MSSRSRTWSSRGSEVFRFALSPLDAWPPRRVPDWAQAVEEAGRRWSAWVEDRHGPHPRPGRRGVEGLPRAGRDAARATGARARRRMCEALLTLHAIADEACAGLGVALDSSDGQGSSIGPVAVSCWQNRIAGPHRPTLVRVLPKVSTPPTGRSAFSRYACVQGPGIDARWHKIPARHRGTDLRSEYANLLLLPWPLRVQASDFHPLEARCSAWPRSPTDSSSSPRPKGSTWTSWIGCWSPPAKRRAASMSCCCPESAVDEGEIDDLETLLDRHGVIMLQAGVRQRSRQPGQFPGNWMHIGTNPETRERRAASTADRTNRGFTSARTSTTAGRSTRTRSTSTTWEAPFTRTSAGGRPWRSRAARSISSKSPNSTLVSLVCEDLAHNDDLAQLIRSVGPTIVATRSWTDPSSSRWTARYASVLADDPGSAVLTLTSYGMVERSRPHGRDASRVIALWKDPHRDSRDPARARCARRSADRLHGSRDPLQRRRPPARGRRDARVRRGRTADHRCARGLGAIAVARTDDDPPCSRDGRVDDPHRLGRGRGRSAQVRAGADRGLARRSAPRRQLARRARSLGAVRPVRRGYRLSRPDRSSGRAVRRPAHIR